MQRILYFDFPAVRFDIFVVERDAEIEGNRMVLLSFTPD